MLTLIAIAASGLYIGQHPALAEAAPLSDADLQNSRSCSINRLPTTTNCFDITLNSIDELLELVGTSDRSTRAKLLTNKAAILYSNKKLEEAIATIDEALELTPANASALFNKALILSAAGRRALALDELERLVAIDPKNPDAFILMSEILSSENKMDAALEFAEQAVKVSPDNADARYARGILLFGKGRHHSAEDDFATAARLGYGPDAYLALVDTQAKLKKYEEALDNVEILLRLSTDNAQGLAARASISGHQGRTDDSLRDYSAAIAIDPTNSTLYVNRGRQYEISGELKKAAEDYKRAATLNPDHPWAGDRARRIEKLR